MAFPVPPTLVEMYDKVTGVMNAAWVDWYARLKKYNETDLPGSFAPNDAQYIVRTPNSNLTDDQALSTLDSGFVKVTTATGVLSSTGSNKIQSSDLADTGVGPGSYTINGSTFTTVDAQGRITSITSPVLTKSDIELGNVEDVALSTWAGSTNITTLGTISTGIVPFANTSGVANSGANTNITSTTSLSSIDINSIPLVTFTRGLAAASTLNIRSQSNDSIYMYSDEAPYILMGYTSNSATSGLVIGELGGNAGQLALVSDSHVGSGYWTYLKAGNSSSDLHFTLPDSYPASDGLTLLGNMDGTTEWGTPVTGGTVTSVTFTGDGTILSSTPSAAVTTSGTVTASLKNQSPNTFLAGASSAGFSAPPTFRLIVDRDLPFRDLVSYTFAGGL